MPGFSLFTYLQLNLLLIVFNFSIIIPIFNESLNIEKLVIEIYQSLVDYNDFELIIINDGSNDDSSNIIKNLQKKYNIKILENKINSGQSYSIYRGINNSKYNTIVTLDGDGQNNPKDIPKLLNLYNSKDNIYLVGGIRKNRKDNLTKIISSKIANKIRSFILKDDCLDTGCSLKVFNKEIFLSFPFFDGIHRFLPALFKGYRKNTFFVDVDHRHRRLGISKYGTIGRLFRGIRDLFRVMLILNKIKRK